MPVPENSTVALDSEFLVSSNERVTYASVSALTFVIYDLILNLPLECQLIWTWNDTRRIFSSRNIFYFICRCGVLLNSILLVVVSLPQADHSKSWCIGLCVPIVVLLLCVEASGHCNTLFSIFLLCERNAKVKRVTIGVAAISYTIACAMLIKYLGPGVQNTSFFSVQLNALHVRFCTINFDSKLALGVWAPPVFVDLCAVALLLWNALEQPRSSNVSVASILTKDGIIILLTGFGLRLSVIVISLATSLNADLLAVLYIEFINAVLNIRLFLMLRGRARPHTSMPDSDDWTSEVVDDNATLASSDIPLKRLAHANEYVY